MSALKPRHREHFIDHTPALDDERGHEIEARNLMSEIVRVEPSGFDEGDECVDQDFNDWKSMTALLARSDSRCPGKARNPSTSWIPTRDLAG